MKPFGTLALALGIVASMADPARAQAPGSFGPGRGAMGRVSMLRNKSIQKELKATPEQARKLDIFFAEMLEKGRKESMRIREAPMADRRAKALEIQRAHQEELRKGLAEILRPEQVKRLEQIFVQQVGVLAFELPQVQEALKLTDEQEARIQGINREMTVSIADLSRTVGRSGDVRKDTEELAHQTLPVRAQALVKCIAALSDDQKAIWTELNGEPFVIVVEP